VFSSNPCSWEYFPHDHARRRAYRWGEDGLLGITDRECRLCFCLSLWNEKDTILKERLFGLTGPEGNHGEDCKELYYYLDSTPTHSYMKGLYKYPQCAYPYAKLVEENRKRGIHDDEYEVEDTGVFKENRYWDVFAEYCKNSPNDILIRITAHNRGPEKATLHLLPTLWYRNTWYWGCTHEGCTMKPLLKQKTEKMVTGKHQTLGVSNFYVDVGPDGKQPPLLFTENETNTSDLYGLETYTPYTRDAFHRFVIGKQVDAIAPNCKGTKVAPHYVLEVEAGESKEVRLRLTCGGEDVPEGTNPFGEGFDSIFGERISEADHFYDKILKGFSAEQRLVARQSYAGLLWSKQFYHYAVKYWLEGDPPPMPPPPASRLTGRNSEWKHLFNRDIVSMPDKWEYPWYASWDLAFHMLPFAKVDPQFAKDQLLLFLREWYMSPNGQIPAYEFAFSDVNPPVHAWAVWRVYKMADKKGSRDTKFLARAFQKLILNFNWWVNRKDPSGKNIFSGGFLGLDNIGIFDRSRPLPTGGELEQADGTAWMAFFCVTMLDIALELALYDDVYEDMASKFFEHFVSIVDAMNQLSGGKGLWNEEDGFYYDHLRFPDGHSEVMRVRSMVGLIPLFACLVLEDEVIQRLSGFKKRMLWFMHNQKHLAKQITYNPDVEEQGVFCHLLAIPSRERLERVLKYLLDEEEFLAPYGIRSLSKYHKDHPFVMNVQGEEYKVQYVPGESNTYLFGGNSNWRGPIWLCVNYLIIESLERYHYYFGEDLKVECPTGSGKKMTLLQVSQELCRRISLIFLPDKNGRRPCHGDSKVYAEDPHWKELVLFYEYFCGNTGRGCGASHQTGWTAVVTRCMDKLVHCDSVSNLEHCFPEPDEEQHGDHPKGK
jgi:hypothetical protein